MVRSLTGTDVKSGAITLNAAPSPGQMLQFQVRDPAVADQNLRARLDQARVELEGADPAGALLCSARRRGVGLFGTADHDAQTVADVLGPIPLGGFLCDGEIGPVGGRTFLHGATASLAFFVRK